ncbi:DUF1566 domain-containing protein [Arcobacter sp. CECT 8985]|uniref:Lcl C-terminal domain-containing protein n=1 Tax=Arcobacter sp. CECT 8985 TaxID=1935424 RepID=UPI00100BA01B|nr:DUF1566 domain-containing protein [Arcobacter sp. CECT 8985]RXJ88079.1 hypothetical protein CRU93_00325 [Arcobacter sp. CECT 8985]
MKFFLFFFLLFNTSIFADCKKVDKSRFTIMENKIFDKKTKLIWMRCSIGSKWKKSIGCVHAPNTISFLEAKALEKKLKNGWRIPTLKELRTIFVSNCKSSAINTTLFPDLKHMANFAPYWTSTPVKELPRLIYYIDFINKTIDAHSKGFTMFVRLVKNKNE